jgi:hypothetical protein
MSAPSRIWIDEVHGQHPDDWSFDDGRHLTKKQKAEKVGYVHEDIARALLVALEDVMNGENWRSGRKFDGNSGSFDLSVQRTVIAVARGVLK